MEYENGGRTELDSHANMSVVGKHAYVVSESGRVAEVSPFTPDYTPMVIPIVDAAIMYVDSVTGVEYILILRNVLHVPSMENNLITPFILREQGIIVNDKAKLHVTNPSENDHGIVFKETYF